eukprot:5217852-Pleurochrysis_carterae.AAC.3
MKVRDGRARRGIGRATRLVAHLLHLPCRRASNTRQARRTPTQPSPRTAATSRLLLFAQSHRTRKPSSSPGVDLLCASRTAQNWTCLVP